MLNLQTLKNCQLPNYDRNKLNAGILHIGIGAFHRAHQIYYIDKLLNSNNTDAFNWGYISGTIRSNSKLIDDLKNNDCLYTLSTNDESGYNYRIIGALKDVYFAGNGQTQELINTISNHSIRIVTYTVTEKGYYVDLSTQKLNISHPDIIADLNNISAPRTAIGITVVSLKKRYETHKEALTLLSCDNMPNNGKILKAAVIEFANKIDKNLAKWIDENCTFPSAMVDRIVPAVTDETIKNIENAIGQYDSSLVATEEFAQWVIEDNFANGRPALEEVSVEFVSDIEPFEKLKLTMLNGSHSLIAYLGAYAGLKTVDKVISTKEFYNFIKKYMLEIAAPLVKGLPASVSTNTYADKLLTRFANPYLKHRTEQIAMDGSKKIPQRWLGSLKSLIKEKKNYNILAIGLAGWILFCSGKDQNNHSLEISDPLQANYKAIWNETNDAKILVDRFLALEEIFSKEFADNFELKQIISKYIEAIRSKGVLEVIKNI
ncbi:mannitol dehydrogenase family protein [Francisella frigiditurris]|uniref:Mannitol dehydrogenase Rossmann domain protein n=1 Tax=Francisella frigiditurris TaxID=1542390 RepID=A0A1J0KTK2_9GAMM|nr:mannitol dehydrogenase family protein [Francisella frigiditurris]APC96964.1 mannitol dehydrogenase Rossmann domain protein [Francisella frigiditurris]